MKKIINKLKKANEASLRLSNLSAGAKNRILYLMAASLNKNKEKILKSNKKDIQAAIKKGLSKALIDRLTLNPSRIEAMIKSLKALKDLPDPVGKVIDDFKRPNGLNIKKISVPIGVILVIYEARPNVTSDVAGICIKSGNAVILKGGSEAINSNKIIHDVLYKAAASYGVEDSIQFIDSSDREVVRKILQMAQYINLVIPRGGEHLIKTVAVNSRIPVLKHYKGICHVYVDKDVNLNMAVNIAYNAKVQRPGVCNAMETLLIHKKIARKFIPICFEKLQEAGIEIRGCPKTKTLYSGIKKATQKDWETEYLDLILSVKIVDSVNEAIKHIQNFGSNHSEAIVTRNKITAGKFLKEVDAAAVYWNASTRFTDGYEFGLGAEIGISTDKLHARGPVALKELTTYKYLIYGKGQIRK
jgi:glutamate-5-semialdehyde dehydrogenase